MGDPLFWHRLQFGFTATYHYLFPRRDRLSLGPEVLGSRKDNKRILITELFEFFHKCYPGKTKNYQGFCAGRGL